MIPSEKGQFGPLHISSAVVRAMPERVPCVVQAIDSLAAAEVYHWEEDKIVVILEGPSTQSVGECLAKIALIEGVVSANLVYEQIETEESPGGMG